MEEGEMPLYLRKITEVYYNDQVTNAWVYWYNDDISGKPVIYSGDVLQYYNEKK
jgi:gamma-glutamylcyclotransferase (GGCT)/AIG2-like uncharacterized protein YtfP